MSENRITLRKDLIDDLRRVSELKRVSRKNRSIKRCRSGGVCQMCHVGQGSEYHVTEHM